MAGRVRVRRELAIRVVYALCLALGTYSHVSALVRHGWGWDYGGMPWGSVIFLRSLTFADPIVAILLFFTPRFAALALVAMMVADVVHNIWMIETYGGIAWMVVDQCIFLAFVVATFRWVWKGQIAPT